MLEEWTLDTTVTTAQIDEAVSKLLELEKIYEEKKKVYREADDAYEAQRMHILELLKSTGKSKYFVEGIGTVSMVIKQSVQVPKTPLEKQEMLDYFKSLGPELYNSYVTVNSQTLNSYINQQIEIDPEFKMPGCENKKETPELRFRKEK